MCRYSMYTVMNVCLNKKKTLMSTKLSEFTFSVLRHCPLGFLASTLVAGLSSAHPPPSRLCAACPDNAALWK